MSIWDAIVRRGQHLLARAAAGLRVRLPEGPLPAGWPALVERNVPLARGLSAADQDRLLRTARLLLDEVPFEGCAGLELDDEIRVTIAATAALLLLPLPYPRFTKLVRVLVYPDTFVPRTVEKLGSSIVHPAAAELGEAWADGIVVLSWADVQADVAGRGAGGGSVVIHELAHILDAEDGILDGTPLFDDPGQGASWARVLERDFAPQRRAVRADREAPLDDYAATNHAEFFAVAAEAFFCTPARLRAALPELYGELRQFFRYAPGEAGT